MADPDFDDLDVTTPSPIGGSNNINLNNERLDCEHLDDITEKWVDPNRPAFVTVLFRFFGNIFVDVFRAVFS
ncbi:uncharacterized protein [Drosophila tropicalis]|uniref:uncharacterized protein n=1 Tax=Drosophila tropicalis TaxID=46794 RepID=UPI0035AC1B10